VIHVTHRIQLDENELQWEFTRSGGPGGQNVNRLETAVQLRFDAANSPSLPADVRRRLLALRDHRLLDSGEVLINSSRFRSQGKNREDALERLVEMIRKASVPPKKRRPTKPSKGAKERRIQSKKQRSDTKRLRGRPGHE
jgi:ribosome-associated protein